MSVALLDETPFSPRSRPGPYRLRDYQTLPDEPRCELIYGRFYVSPSPTPRHQMVAFLLARMLARAVEPRGGLVLPAPLDVALGEHSAVQPDVIYVSPERRGIVGERIEGAPDLLVEVLSPGTVRRDRMVKLALYAEAGVREYWIVDPEERQIEFLIHRGGRFVVALPEDDRYRSEALPEITVDLAELWRRADEMLPR